jgi:hypothetical protein
MAPLRGLLLGCVVAVTSGAQAADLPVKGAAPVDYVRVCPAYGTGFFYVPGTDSCLRIGGRVRADYLYQEPFTRAQDAIGFRARGRLNVDYRTMTEYGLLRTYLRYEIDRNTGVFAGDGQVGTNPKVRQAFVQFGGLTAGRALSFFSDPDLPVPNFGDLRFDDPSNADINLFAYTFSFGSGFSATLSLEDSIERRNNNEYVFPLFAPPAFAPIPFTFGGERMPDVVANVRYTGSWGGAQLSGAVHQIRDVAAGATTVDGVIVPVINPITGLPNPAFADTDYGFAAALNAYANIPFLGVGDTAWVSATYTDGAVAYINAGQTDPISNSFISAGPLALAFADAFVDPFTGDFKTNKAYGIAGGINHNLTPTVETNIFGSFMRFDASGVGQSVVPVNAATVAAGTAGTVTGVADFNEYRIGGNAIWKPVSGLQLGAEVLYARIDPRGRVAVPITNFAGDASGFFKPTGSDDIWEARLRVQRDF